MTLRFAMALLAALFFTSCSAKFRAIKSDDENGSGDAAKSRDGLARVHKTFNYSGEGEHQFLLKDGIISQELTMTEALGESKAVYNQVERPLRSKHFTQGTSGESKTDTYMQAPGAGVLDILIVMDNSGSMQQEQVNMSSRMAPLLQYVSNANWRIGVVTTTLADGCLRDVIHKGESGAASNYSRAILAGIGGSGTERGIEMATKALDCADNKWVREKSTLAVLIVSDEDNCSNGSGCGSNYGYTPNSMKNFLATTMDRTVGVDARVYGIIWRPGTSCSTGYNVAHQYAKLISDTQGVSGSICASSYTSVLQSISSNIAEILKSQFQLSSKPDAGTVSVKVNNVNWPDFQVSGNVITFTKVPANGTTIKVSYTTGAKPFLPASGLVLAETPAPDTVEVQVNSQKLGAGDFTVDAANQRVKLKSSPAANAEVKVTYRVDVPLKKTFDIGKNAIPNSVKVEVNGAAVSSSYSSATGLVTLPVSPVDGAFVHISYTQIEGPKLTYEFVPVGEAFSDLQAFDKASGQAVAVEYVGNQLKFRPEDFAKGKVIVVRYRNDQSGKMDVELPFEPINGSLIIGGAPDGCALGQGIELEGKTLHISCHVPSDLELTITYNYEAKPDREYVIGEVTKPDDGSWQVYVNGDEVKNYERSGNIITFSDDLPVGAKVEVIFTPSENQ